MTHHDPEKLKQILTWIGVANQLVTTRLNQLMSELDLPLSQFIMLNHFSHHPQKGETVTQLTSAFQANQPAISKTVQHLLKKGYLSVQTSEQDKRVKYHYLTEAGLKAHQQIITQLGPDSQMIFADWSTAEIDSLHQSLFRLKNWLDDHRDSLAQP